MVIWRLREFNFVLLDKWCERMKVENMSLWYAEGGRFNSGGGEREELGDGRVGY